MDLSVLNVGEVPRGSHLKFGVKIEIRCYGLGGGKLTKSFQVFEKSSWLLIHVLNLLGFFAAS